MHGKLVCGLVVGLAQLLLLASGANGSAQFKATIMNKLGALEEKLASLEKENMRLKAQSADTEESAVATKSQPTGNGAPDGGPVDWPPKLPQEDQFGKGQQVPFGKHIPRVPGVTYYVANGMQECMLCGVSHTPTPTPPPPLPPSPPGKSLF